MQKSIKLVSLKTSLRLSVNDRFRVIAQQLNRYLHVAVPIKADQSIRTLRSMILFCSSILASNPFLAAQEPTAESGIEVGKSNRVTPLVEVIRKIEPAVVSLFTPTEANQIVSGSGTIIHPSGYVLTNNHVLPKPVGFAIRSNDKPVRFEVVSRYPETDIAIVRLKGPLESDASGNRWPFLPLGHSSETLLGESIVVAGNPGGRGMAFTSGIISAKDVLEGGPNAMIMSNYTNDRRGRLLQFDAASNKGNSGGPLVNMDAEVIGVVSAVIQGEQNIGLAIPVDRVRDMFQRMIEPELAHNKSTGLELDPFAKKATLTRVNTSEVAEGNSAVGIEHDLQSGDTILAVNGYQVRDAIDWYLTLESLLPTTDQLRISYSRDNVLRETTLKTSAAPSQSVVVDRPTNKGLRYRLFEGSFSELPDFTKLVPVRNATTDSLDIGGLTSDRPENFAMEFTGFLKVETEGLYRVVLISDDGSKLYLNDNLFIDHDGNHPAFPSGRMVRLQAGLLPIRLEYFQGNGAKTLHLVVEPCSDRRQISLVEMKLVQGERLRSAEENP
jgi:S1-C subfamily serine protease